MSTITQSGPNQPDFTTPVSSIGRSRFIGIVGNMDNGTAKGTLTNGNANNNIGGTVFRAAGASSNQFPVQAADAINTGSGGSAPQPTNSSQNPLTVQAQTLNRVTTEQVQQTTPALVSNASAGNYVTFPQAVAEIELGTGSVNSTSSNLLIKNERPVQNYAGITDTLTMGNANDITLQADNTRVVNDTLPAIGGHVDGAAQGANYVDKFIALGDNVQTPAMNELPGGVAISPEIGESNVSGLGL